MKKYFLQIVLCFVSLCLCIWVSFWADLLSKAYEPAFQQDLILDLGDKKENVGHSVTKNQTNVDIIKLIKKDPNVVNKNPPLLARIAQILLRFTVAIAVSMIIYNAIIYGMKVLWWDDYKSKESLKKLSYVGLGILLALFSIVIINLIRSLTTTVITPL